MARPVGWQQALTNYPNRPTAQEVAICCRALGPGINGSFCLAWISFDDQRGTARASVGLSDLAYLENWTPSFLAPSKTQITESETKKQPIPIGFLRTTEPSSMSGE
jgi:hypothetical protein